MKIKYKKAGERYLSPVFFAMLFVVAALIAFPVFMFYGASADVRIVEAEILATRILNCINENFEYADLIKEDFDLYELCDLNKEVLLQSENYYISLSIKNLASGAAKTIVSDGVNWTEECDYQKKQIKDGKNQQANFPQCSSKLLIISEDLGTEKTGGAEEIGREDYILNVVTASNQK